ncbi:tetratricopeptide repeat-containing glycosyltransferase family 2 protein [Metabacillus niabensis]|uniref:Glycosyltransferase involved in cell wall biosynthesis n=1 Tax=Metabacillus niabensis TaxID=324854 RepID=A0ABT9Z5L5_9BACI|nr:glycosyltransferase family 2 protein [Metabacillus niabensis]MDQ0227136.1 glycosyltransferase involved in cell wall biosynthesis [Metabacillus niabensis]
MEKFISLCMIVKNEEKVIERCLSSVAHLVDEIIVVDTGSTDRTKEIVSKYTSHIYDFKWIEDFSAARNFAASKATGKWILVLDADEYVDEENFQVFLTDLRNENDDYDAYYAKILNFAGSFGETLVQNYHDRIYKNNGKISYYRKIHEQFKHNEGVDLKYKNSNLLIFHSGYLKHTVDEKDKNKRNKKLIDIEMSNENKNAFDYFNLGNEYSSMGDVTKALDAYVEAYKLKSDFRLSWVSTTLIQIVICLIQLKRFNDALNVLDDAGVIYENSPEFLYLKGEIFFLRGQMDDAKEVFLEIVNNPENYYHIIFRPDLKDQKPHSRLGDIYLSENDYNNAIFHYTSLLNINKYNTEGINKVVTLLNKFHTSEEISDFLNSKGLVNAKNIQHYISAAFSIGNPELALSLLEFYFEENQFLYKVALLKKYTIKSEGDLKGFSEILKDELMGSLYTSGWINLIDLYLLKKTTACEEIVESSLQFISDNENITDIFKFLDNKLNAKDISKELLIYVLQIGLIYKNDDICNIILDDIEKLDTEVIYKVANMLFTHGFKVEGLELYNMCDWSMFEINDFINIIDSLLEINNIEGAVEVAKYSTGIFNEDFRFYKYIIDNSRDINFLQTTISYAKGIFSGSKLLDTYMF